MEALEMKNLEIRELKEEVCRLASEPRLGCATTAEMIDEIRARIELDGKLDYKTVDRDQWEEIHETGKKTERKAV